MFKAFFYKKFLALLPILLVGCAQPYKATQMYGGPPMADAQVAAIMHGTAEYQGETVYGIVVGVDKRLCPGPETRSPGLPDNTCGNNLAVAPGEHIFNVVVQAENVIRFLGPVITNSWKRSPAFETTPFALDSGTLYRMTPVISSQGFSARLDFVCKSSNHAESIKRVFMKQSCL
jgi:hypothetical protein